RAARYGKDVGYPAPVEGGGAGDLLGRAPGAVRLVRDEHLTTSGGACVRADDGAVARRGTRHRGDLGGPAPVEGHAARKRPRDAPPAMGLGDNKRMLSG